MIDVVIIGAGVSGCAIARELSRYQMSICVLDRNSDVCEGTSKANSAIVHAGFDARPGTLSAKLNVKGNKMMDEVSEELDVPFRRNGSMVLCWDSEGVSKLEELLERGKKNGVEGMSILSADEARKIEPNLAEGVYAALNVPSGGIVCPFTLTIAYAENAASNGVEFRLSEAVELIEKIEGGYAITTSKGRIETRYVINAAGVYADVLHNMVSSKKLHITARKGEYILLDKSCGKMVDHTIFQLPNAMGKGVLVTPTIHGNLLVGPTATDIEDKDNTATTAPEIAKVIEKSALSVRGIPYRQVITSFAGLRAHEDGDDFVIGEAEDAPGFIDVAGIESPGLSSAPAIGEYVRDIVAGLCSPEEKKDFDPVRHGIKEFSSMTTEEQKDIIAKNPAYGQVICRCETVTEGEILEAIHRPVGATTLDGVKRRTRAGMGRCQAGFCTPKTMEILARELGTDMGEISKNSADSRLIVGINKDRLGEES